MRRYAPLLVLIALLGTSGAVAFNHFSQSSDSPLDQIQKTLDADSAKGQFTGPLGDFLVFSRTDPSPHDVIDCPATSEQFTADGAALSRSELWRGALGSAATGISCEGKIVVANSGQGPLPDGTQSIVVMYFKSLPAPVALDAPKDRIQLTTINGRAAIVEEPLPGYPYATASVALIERYPSADHSGIITYINFAPTVDAALGLARQVAP